MADYSRPASGFRYRYAGLKLNSPPDALGTDKYAYALNIRETQDSAVKTRPGLSQLFTTAAAPVTDIRAYTALGTDDLPRLLARSANGNIYLDNGASLGAIGSAPDGKLGVSMIPFRPSQSPVPYMYIANGVDYYKFSAPSAANAVSVSKAGIAEPLAGAIVGSGAISPAIQPWVIGAAFSSIGPPLGQTFSPGGNASAITTSNRLTDMVQGIFTDPLSSGSLTTLQVTAGSSLAAGIYLNSAVRVYFFNESASPQGAYRDVYPVNTGMAAASAQGNSLMFNPPQFNGTENPSVHPMEWAVINSVGGITGYTTPYAADTGFSYYMVVEAQLYIPVAGSYTLNINHDDGMIFAIEGASLVSGPVNDPFTHTKTGVNGYKWTNGTIAGVNGQGYHKDVYVVNFPAAGTYSMEIDYAQLKDNQNLNVYSNGAPIFQASASNAYQRGMVVSIAAKNYIVDDVYPPLPQSLSIAGIYYFSGNTGLCTIVPRALGPATGTQGQSLFSQTYLSSIRRGSLVQVGAEICLVLGTNVGPDGTISFQTSTVGAHTTSDRVAGVPAIGIHSGVAASVGAAITSPDATFGVTAGISTASIALATNPFINNAISFQDEDYIHLSVNIDNLASINEIKLLFDCGDGTFTQNLYQYVIRPSDIAAGVQNLLTQLGVAQLVSQRATIDEEKADTANNQGVTTSSAQTSAGNAQWSEIKFQISELTRIGNDQAKSLQNANAMQVLINANGTANIAVNSVTISGGFAPDVGPSGAPYQYRMRGRSQVTGARSNATAVANWSVSPRRERVFMFLYFTSLFDPQIDTWDIYRYGGTVTSWRHIGSIPVGQNAFLDNFGDDTADAGEGLEFDNYEPWPTVDVPFSTLTLGGTTSVVGNTIVVRLPIGAPYPNLLRYLPGNEIQVLDNNGPGHVYTLWTRPTQIAPSTYLLQLEENAGVSTAPLLIAEPDMARQPLPYMWGPDESGTVFAVGDVLRAGSLYLSKPNNPDSALDATIEITPPSEPLLGGEVMAGVSYVASTERWWRLYPQLNRPQRYNPVQQPIPRGMAAPLGHCTDGKDIFFWAKDGIWSTGKGSLTDADLYNLFPHEGVAGANITYNGQTVFAPDYSRAGTFRLSKVNNYLYAVYQDMTASYRQLTCDLRTGAWVVDQAANPVSAVYHPEQQEGSLFSTTMPPSATLYPTAVMGTVAGIVGTQQDATNDLGAPIVCAVASTEWDGGDFRAGKQWGDIFFDAMPQSDLTVTPMSGGIAVITATTIPSATTRLQSLISLGGGLLNRFLGLQATWMDDFTEITSPTTLYGWQPSFLSKQEMSADRDSDWIEVQPGQAAGFVQGFRLRADTFNVAKSILVQDSDTLQLHAFTPTVQHNGESTRPYSFTVPFVTHLIRIVPQDLVPWRLFYWEPVAEPTPEAAETWQTQGTSFGSPGYKHIQRLTGAYVATAPITITITVNDGTAPAPIVLPSSGGAYQKLLQVLTFNKGQLYFFKAQSTVPFQLWLDDFEVVVGDWGRSDGYRNYRSLGGKRGDNAKI